MSQSHDRCLTPPTAGQQGQAALCEDRQKMIRGRPKRRLSVRLPSGVTVPASRRRSRRSISSSRAAAVPAAGGGTAGAGAARGGHQEDILRGQSKALVGGSPVQSDASQPKSSDTRMCSTGQNFCIFFMSKLHPEIRHLHVSNIPHGHSDPHERFLLLRAHV